MPKNRTPIFCTAICEGKKQANSLDWHFGSTIFIILHNSCMIKKIYQTNSSLVKSFSAVTQDMFPRAWLPYFGGSPKSFQ